MRDLPQYQHADLGLIPDVDNTDDLRPNKTTTPVLEHRGRQKPQPSRVRKVPTR